MSSARVPSLTELAANANARAALTVLQRRAAFRLHGEEALDFKCSSHLNGSERLAPRFKLPTASKPLRINQQKMNDWSSIRQKRR
jgi:hypothetical protein